jgi:hypothetical protein
MEFSYCYLWIVSTVEPRDTDITSHFSRIFKAITYGTQFCGPGSGIQCLFDPWIRIRDEKKRIRDLE